MYTRLNSRRMPSMVLRTDNEWEIAEDKSCVLIRGDLLSNVDDGTAKPTGLITSPICTERHAVHVYMNPKLGSGFQIITPDDGPVDLVKPAKNKLSAADDLEWHYKVFIVRVDLPPA